MTRPLGSTSTAPSRGFLATTNRSAGASRDGTHCLAVQPLGRLPLAIHNANGGVGTRLPTFRTGAADRTHVAYMPDTTWPVSGHPPGSSRAFLLRPGFDATYLSYDTSTAIPHGDCAPSFRSPPDASRAPFSTSLTTTVFSQRSMWWFEASHRRATPKGQTFISCTAPHQESPYLQTELPSTFVAHVGSHAQLLISGP